MKAWTKDEGPFHQEATRFQSSDLHLPSNSLSGLLSGVLLFHSVLNFTSCLTAVVVCCLVLLSMNLLIVLKNSASQN
jgi:hypothetical protein